MKNNEIMQGFTIKNIPDLDVCVLGALEIFMKEKLPKINIPYKHPLVVGSGNAEATGRIIFKDKDAVFASESSFEENLKKIKSIDGVVVVSASGGKHAPIIAKTSKKFKKKVTLVTTNPNAQAKQFSNNTFVFPKQREPYTYNTSTYMGMILGKTNETPKIIYNFLKNKIDKIKLPNFKKYKKFYVIIPSEFSEMKRMIQVKFIELFGREIARDVETVEYVKHATTVTPSKNELFISFGWKNNIWGRSRLNIPLPPKANYGSLMAVSYYIVGKIQKSHNPYFKNNIDNYVKKISKIFKQKIGAIVE